MENKRKRDLTKNTVIISFGTVLPRLASIITLPILTASLTKAEYGTYDLINTLIALLLPIVTLQIQMAAFRFIISNKDNENEKIKIITNIFFFIAVTTILALTILYFSLYKLSVVDRILICVYFFADIYFVALQQVVRGLALNVLYTKSTIIRSVVNVIFIFITLSVLDSSLTGVLISMSIATIVGMIILYINGQIRKYLDFNQLSKKTIAQMISYSWPMIPNSLSLWVMNLSDRILITGFLGLEANAIYAIANKIPSLFSVVQSAFVLAWQENASIASKDQDAGAYYSVVFKNIFSILIGCMSILIAATPFLFMFLIKGDYEDSYYQMPILLLGMLFSSLASFMGGIYVAHMKTKSVGITTVIAALINFSLNFLLIPKIGLFAASTSTTISYLFLSIYRMYDIQKFQKIEYENSKNIMLIIILILMSIFTFIKTPVFYIVNIIISLVLVYFLNMDMLLITLRIVKGKIKSKF